MNNNNELKQAKFLSVSALNRYLSYKFDMDVHLQTVYLEGEISNFKISGKHMYFSIKDEYSEISAMMFYPNNSRLDFEVKDGMVVQLVGKVGVYEKRGTYSIVVNKMIQAGIGLLYQNFIDLKDKLQNEGLFDQRFKKKIPEFPNTIGVITSATGEAINDILSTLKKRMPLVKIVLYPAQVQGSDAPKDLIRALKLAYLNNEIDCLIIGRGGGSFEDLSCFNDEELARCLFQAPFPTISAVGHEGDYTICDFVASLRAPTPTGAAMLAVKNQEDIIENVNILKQRLISSTRVYFSKIEKNLNYYQNSYGIAQFDQIIGNLANKSNVLIEKLKQHSPIHLLEKKNEQLQNNLNYMKLYFSRYLENLNNSYHKDIECLSVSYQENLEKYDLKLEQYCQKMILLNPLNLMKKGYSIVYQDENVISSVKKIDKNKNIKIKLFDGEIDTKIINVKEE